MRGSKLYGFLLTGCAAGYIWLYYAWHQHSIQGSTISVCLFKNVANIPCPSCGATRSILALTHGHFAEALCINPLGLLLAFLLLSLPVWIAFDAATRNTSLWHCYQQIEKRLKQPQYAIPLILLVITNWIWNITKGL